MTPRTLIKQTAKELTGLGIENAQQECGFMLAQITGMDAMTLQLDMDTALTDEVISAFNAMVEKRREHIPLQYILGTQPFLGREFIVTPDVLIPRIETEQLCTMAIGEAIDRGAKLSVLDLCTGSGCIAVSLALALPESTVDACDLSEKALSMAQHNAEQLHAHVAFLQGDLLSAAEGRTYDMIVSNPPYIPRQECTKLQPEVLQEPMMALDGGEDGLNFYRRIAMNAPKYLNPGGTLLMEIGYDQGESVPALLSEAGFSAPQVFRDQYDHDRIVRAVWRGV